MANKLKTLIVIIVCFLPLLLCSLAAAGDETNTLIHIKAKIVAYYDNAINVDFDGGGFYSWDVIALKIISPSKWQGKEINIEYVLQEPENSPWRIIGSICEFSIDQADIKGEDPVEVNKELQGEHAIVFYKIKKPVNFVE